MENLTLDSYKSLKINCLNIICKEEKPLIVLIFSILKIK